MNSIPTLDLIKELYESPMSPNRFDRYLRLLQGSEAKDLMLPIAGFNPMAKPTVLEKVNELIALRAEDLVEDVIRALIQKSIIDSELTLGLAINVGDDIGGSWTTRYQTDYESKYRIKPMLKRNFCILFFWSSESYNRHLIEKRIKAYILRYIYQLEHGSPQTLQDHINIESFVYSALGLNAPLLDNSAKSYLEQRKNTTSHPEIFNFLYGDDASIHMGYSHHGCDQGYPFFDQ